MSIKGMDAENEGTESHPILRVHNYKKPQLEKINHGQPQQLQSKNINFTVDNVGQQNQNGNI